MKTKFIPLDYDYFDFEGKNYIQLVGRNEKGEKICIIDSYEPNFWLILEDFANPKEVEKKISETSIEKSSRNTTITKTEIHKKKFLGIDVNAIKVYVTNHKDAHDIASQIGEIKEIKKRREYDISIITKYIKEKKIEPLKWHDVDLEEISEFEFGGNLKDIFLEKCFSINDIKISKNQEKFEPKILAYDIETTSREIEDGQILMISLSGINIKKVLTWKKIKDPPKYVEIYKDEADMIESFAKIVRESDADILTGYYSDGFDLPYIRYRAQENNIKLDLGINGKNPTFSSGRIISGKISGTVHIDIYRFISSVFSQYLKSETLSLNEVAKELIGESKEEFDFRKLTDMSDSDWQQFFSYSMQDAIVTKKLLEKIWPDIFEFTRIIKEPLFQITRDTMSMHVENHIIHNADRFNEIVEKRPGLNESNQRKLMSKFEGAIVLEPKPGLYENIVMFDFTSMHASIIVSFNISKATLRLEKEKDTIESPEFEINKNKTKVYFTKEQGFFAKLLSEIVEKRKEYKKEYNQNKNPLTLARSNAYKLLANATFGYQGFFQARYYSYEAAAATLAFVRKYSTKTIKKIEEEGFPVIYSDTDSMAFIRKQKTKNQIKELLKKLNKDLPGIMELDLEDFYQRGIFVSKRGSKTGAKKKYALIDEEGKIKIRGFETVRRDWCQLSRKLQNKILEKTLKDGDEKEALKITKETVEKIKNRQISKDDLIIKTKLSRPISEYTSIGPHVIAAKKIEETGIKANEGKIIEYYIGESSGKLVRDKVHLPEENAKYDIDYYLNKQVIPAIENIFDVFGINVKQIIDGETQRTLF